MKRLTAAFLAALITIETAGAPIVTHAAEVVSTGVEAEAVLEGSVEVLGDEGEQQDDPVQVASGEGNSEQSGQEPGTGNEEPEQSSQEPGTGNEEPEQPPFVSPVSINKTATIKLGEGYDRIRILSGSWGTIDLSADKDSDFHNIIPSLTKRQIISSNNAVLSVSEAAGSYSYSAVGHGAVTVTVIYGINGSTEEYYETFECYVTSDMTNVVPESSTYKYSYDGSNYKYDSGQTTAKFTFTGIPEGDEPLAEHNAFLSYSKKKGNKVQINRVSLYDNVLSVSASGSGTAVLKVTINKKVFELKIKLMAMKLNKSTALVVKGKSVTLVPKNFEGDISWKSSNTRVATVAKNGKVRAKKEGSSLITATVGDMQFYAVVNVVSKKKMKAIKVGKKIIKGRYSQAKRMRSGYYDCSSLVWRICKSAGITRFGANWYAPVAASEAYYLVRKHKKVAKISSKNIQKRKFNPGDLYFATGRNNHRYKGIYHVEMFTGYDIQRLDSKGKPIYSCMWLNRVTGYPYFSNGLQKGFLARP